ncbi:MAG TPA: alpha/beta fold hydrolase [Streptosporangiaceae bacterium]|nr:alpha/beta fold hydrolase [Streptosporangiaceae bacterium]
MTRSLVRWLVVMAWAGALAACSSNGRPETPPTSPPSSPAATTAAAQSAPPGLVEACSTTSGVRARSMWFAASDGVRLYGIEAGTGRTAVVLAHEGGADLCGWLPYVRTLQDAGLRVFAFDFRGYGLSEGSSSADLALGRDLAGAVARVRADGAAEVFLMGASMGGAAVVQNSAGIDVAGRISLSGTRLWSGYGFNDPAGVRRISAPFLYVGTRHDWRAPRPEALSVFGMIGSADKKIVLYPGSDHGWDLVKQPPDGMRARALILRWIQARSR